MVHPEYQGKEIGKQMVKRAILDLTGEPLWQKSDLHMKPTCPERNSGLKGS